MAEEARPTPNVPDTSGTPAAPEHTDTDWGADWESAFQAEDDSFFAGADEEFFLEEEATKGTTPSAAADATLEKALAEAAAQPAAGASGKPLLPGLSLAPFQGLVAKIITLPTALLSLPRLLWQRFTALPVRSQLMVLALLLLLPIVATTAIWLLLPQATPKVPPPSSLSPVAVSKGAGAPQTGGVPAVPEKVHKKLVLNDFFIPVRDNAKESGPLLFVQIDLTLNTMLGAEEDLPPAKEAVARDIIYQFFANRTVTELRRYQLARGDLQRDLRAWLEKQWADTPIESITFTRYQLS